MASVLQHQVESRVNDLYLKMQNHAKLIMRLAVEVDKLKNENESYKTILSDHECVIEDMINNILNKKPIRNDDGEENNENSNNVITMDINTT